MEREIDLVYLWVDGSDQEWLTRKLKYTGKFDDSNDGNCKARFINNDELKFSIRSVEKYIPWVRNIFIVTDNQVPKWLDTDNPRVKVINQSDLIPKESIPCYNSTVIESYLYKIPGLSECFLYSNDDMFVGKPLTPDFFFTKEGFPVVMLVRKSIGKLSLRFKRLFNIHISLYRKTVRSAALLVKREYGKDYTAIPHHNFDAYLKSDCQKVIEEVFKAEAEEAKVNHLRAENDLQRVIFSYYALATKRGKLKYVDRYNSDRMSVRRTDHMDRLNKYKPALFCINDAQAVTDEDRLRVRALLEQLFPDKTSFEK